MPAPAPVLSFPYTGPVDSLGSGVRLLSDSGVIIGDDELDSIERQVLVTGGARILRQRYPRGSPHPDEANMFLDRSSYAEKPDGSVVATLSYIGVAGRQIGRYSTIPSAPDRSSMKISYSYSPKQVDFDAGTLTVVNNFCGFSTATNGLPSTVGVYRRVITAVWINSQEIDAPAPSANMLGAWGAVSSWNGWLQNPTRNIPWGNVPNNVSCEPLIPGTSLWSVKIELLETPQYGP